MFNLPTSIFKHWQLQKMLSVHSLSRPSLKSPGFLPQTLGSTRPIEKVPAICEALPRLQRGKAAGQHHRRWRERGPRRGEKLQGTSIREASPHSVWQRKLLKKYWPKPWAAWDDWLSRLSPSKSESLPWSWTPSGTAPHSHLAVWSLKTYHNVHWDPPPSQPHDTSLGVLYLINGVQQPLPLLCSFPRPWANPQGPEPAGRPPRAEGWSTAPTSQGTLRDARNWGLGKGPKGLLGGLRKEGLHYMEGTLDLQLSKYRRPQFSFWEQNDISEAFAIPKKYGYGLWMKTAGFCSEHQRWDRRPSVTWGWCPGPHGVGP